MKRNGMSQNMTKVFWDYILFENQSWKFVLFLFAFFLDNGFFHLSGWRRRLRVGCQESQGRRWGDQCRGWGQSRKGKTPLHLAVLSRLTTNDLAYKISSICFHDASIHYLKCSLHLPCGCLVCVLFQTAWFAAVLEKHTVHCNELLHEQFLTWIGKH